MVELFVLVLILGIVAGIVWVIPVIPVPFKYALIGILVIIAVLYVASMFGHPLVRFPR